MFPSRPRRTVLGRDLLLDDRLAPSSVYTLTGRTWTITSQDTDGVSWTGSTLVFTAQTDSPTGLNLDGYFDWTADSGASGRELFHGTLTESTRGLEMEGYQLQNNNGIILASYTATLAVSGNAIVNGQWPEGVAGTWSATAPAAAFTLSSPTVREFRPTGTAVGTLSGPVAPYTLVNGNGSADNAKFGIAGNKLVTARPLDFQAQSAFSVRVRAADGTEQAFAVSLTDNAQVALANRTLTVTGTVGNDTYGFTAGAVEHGLVLNGADLAVRAADADLVHFDGGAGSDAATLTARGTGNAAAFWPGAGRLTGSGYAAVALGEQLTGYGGAGDGAYLNDSAGNDVFVAASTYAYLQGSNFRNAAVGFGGVTGYASGGTDAAYLNDSAANDVYSAAPTYALLKGPGFWNTAVGFDGVTGYGSAGVDAAYLTGSAGADVFSGTPTYSFLNGPGFWNTAVGFDGVNASGGGGADGAYLTDGPGTDFFNGSGGTASLAGTGYFVGIEGFAGVTVYGTGGGTNRRTVGTVNYWLGFVGTWA